MSATPDPLALHRLQQWVANGVTKVSMGPIVATDAAADWTDRSVPASAVISLIKEAGVRRQPFSMCGARIIDSMSLELIEVSVPITFESCRFDAGFSIASTSARSVTFRDSLLKADITGRALSGCFAEIKGELDMAGSSLDGAADLAGVSVSGSISFARCPIVLQPATTVAAPGSTGTANPPTWSVDLTNASMEDLVFEACPELSSGLCVAGADIRGQLNLRGATLNGHHDGTALWAQRVSIAESVLASTLPTRPELGPATFRGMTDLLGAEIKGSLWLTDARFEARRNPASNDVPPPPRLRLTHASIGRTLRLTGVSFVPGTQVELGHASVGRLEGVSSSWKQVSYDVSGLSYDDIDGTGAEARNWTKGARPDLPGAYLQLADASAALGRPNDERRARILASSRAASWPERALLGWVRYGYRPYLVIVPLLILGLACLAQVEHTADQSRGFAPVVVGDEEITPATCDDTVTRCLNTVLYAVDSVLPLDLKQVSSWRPNTTSRSGRTLAYLVTVNEVAAWVLAGVFIAAVAGRLNRT